MGFGTTFAMLSFLMIFAGMTYFVTTVQETITGAATAIQQQSQTEEADIQIIQTNRTENKQTQWRITYADEFSQGEFTNTQTQGDAVTLQPSQTTGTYESPIYDTQYNTTYQTISWSAITNGGATIEFRIRSANDIPTLEASTFIGRNGNPIQPYTTPGFAIHSSHQNDRYIQYQATLNAGAGFVELQDTTITLTRQTNATTITLENTGDAKLQAQHTDVYLNGIRQNRNTLDYTLEQTLDERLWNPGEELNITVYGTQGGESITVENNNAQDSQ